MAKKLSKIVTNKTNSSIKSITLLYIFLFFIGTCITAFLANKNQNTKKQFTTQIETITNTPAPTIGINPETGWKIYRKSEREYQFEYPSDFKIAPESFSNVKDPVIQFTHFVSVTGDDFSMGVMSHQNPKSLNILEWLSFLKENKIDYWSGTTGDAFINNKVDNEDAFSFWEGGTNGGKSPGNSKQSSQVYDVFVTHNTHAFRINFTSPSGFSQEKFNLFKEILSTFKFTTQMHTTTEKSTDGWIYTDREQGFVINYPLMWKSEKPCNNGLSNDSYLCIQSPSFTVSPIPHVLTGELITIGPKGSGRFVATSTSLKVFCNADDQIKIRSCEKTQYNGISAIKKVWENYPIIDVAILKDNEIKFIIRLQYAQELLNTSHEFTDFDSIVSSFKLLE